MFKNTRNITEVNIEDKTISYSTYYDRDDFIIKIDNAIVGREIKVNIKGTNILVGSDVIINEEIKNILFDLEIRTNLKEELDKILFSDLEIRKKRIKIRKLKRKGLDKKYINVFINLLEYIEKSQYNTQIYKEAFMKDILKILLEFLIVYIGVFILYWLIFVRKKTKYNPNKVPVEFYYLVSLYRLDQSKINYKKFIYATAFVNTFIIDTTYIIISKLLDKWMWQLIVGIFIIILLIIILYGLMGRYYQKHGMVSTPKKAIKVKDTPKDKNVPKKTNTAKKRGNKNV